MSHNLQVLGVVVRVVIRRPGLTLEAVRFALATARLDWFRRPPFLPLPDPAYLDWRIATAYGDSDASITMSEMQEFLVWCRAVRGR